MKDQKGDLTIEEISSPEYNSRFIQSKEQVLSFGMQASVYWVRFHLQAPIREGEDWLIESKNFNMQEVTLYIPNSGQSWTLVEKGKNLPFDQPLFINNDVILRIPTPIKNDQILYLRFDFLSESVLDLKLWSQQELQKDQVWNLYFKGMVQGFLIIMVVYNFFLFLSIKDRSYLFYTLYLSALVMLFMTMDGVGYHYFWRVPNELIMPVTFISFNVFECFFVLFVKSFLRTSQFTPKLDRLLTYLLLGILTGTTAFLTMPTVALVVIDFMVICTVLVLITVIVSAIYCIKKGYQPAKFFLLASSTFIAAIAMGAGESLSIFPQTADASNPFMKIGIILEAVMYSFALADRFKYERRQKEESQKVALENLQQANLLKDEFLANTSHELRTPLNGIIGLAEATLHDMDKGSLKKIRTNLSHVISSGRRLSLLVNDILDFSKLKHKPIPLHLRPINLHRVIESVLVLSQPFIQGKPLKLINEIEKGNSPVVLADEARLEQIFHNLISNAIKFTHEGCVTISTEQTEKQIIISITDTGIGIPENKLSQIFNAFEQIDGTATRRYEGTGLGLTVVKQLVELHKSALSVKSEENQGSVFSFTLNLSPEKDQIFEFVESSQSTSAVSEIVIPNESTPDEDTPSIPGLLNILIVDDDALNIEVISQQLEAEHYSIKIAHNGAEALEMVERQKPDLILLDVMMPEISGFDVCEQLRSKYHQSHLPIIFLTAKNREEDVIHGLEIGGNDYLTKPFFRSELIQRVETHLENMLHQKQADALQNFSNKISQYVSREEMIGDAFGEIAQWSLVDEATLFLGGQTLFHHCLDKTEKSKILKNPTKALLKELNLDLSSAQIIIKNAVEQAHPVEKFYTSGHFLFITPQHLPDHLLVFYRKLERQPFDESKAASYVQGMMNQIQTTQSNLESLFNNNELVSVIGKVQPRLSEITHVKSASPTLELYFDSDKRPEYIDGCSLEKLSLYFKESMLLRTHKSYLVNVSKVVSLQKTSKSRLLEMVLTSGEIIPVGRTYMDKVRQVFAGLL
ncbi:MAG: response regulator [Proteobacteria bacterium]|nr:response regulator [Pseudomonadota bacterium]